MKIDILKLNKEEFESRVTQLNKKLVKQGYSEITYQVLREYEYQFKHDGRKFNIPYLEIEVQTPMESFKVPGFTFLGSIVRNESGVTIYSSDDIDLREYVNETRCDVCKTNRYRSRTYIFENDETRDRILIGSSCVKDYFTKNIDNLLVHNLDFCKFLIDLSDEDSDSYRNKVRDYIDFQKAVLVSTYYIQKFNTYLKSNPDQYGTGDYVRDLLNPNCYTNEEHREYKKELNQYKEWQIQNEINPEEIIKYWSSHKDTNNFEFNIKQKFENCSISSLSLVACGVNQFMKEKGLLKKKETKEKKLEQVSEYIGNVGEKLEKQLGILNKVGYESEYGIGYIYILSDNYGNVYKWSTNKNIKDEKLNARFTIKDHSEYRGTKQTVITRLKIK